MAGERAAARGMPLVDGNAAGGARALDDSVNETRDFVADAMDYADGKSPTGHKHPMSDITDLRPYESNEPLSTARRDAAGNLTMTTGFAAGGTGPATNHLATRGYVDSAVAGVAPTMQANGPTATAYGRPQQGTDRFVVWMNSALEFMRGTSARKYKKNIRSWAPAVGAVMGLRTVIFDRKVAFGGELGEVGFIADEVGEVLPDAVLYFDGEIDGIDDRVILAALVHHVQTLTRRVEELGGN